MPKIEIVRDDVVGGYTLRGHCPICGESFDSKGVYGPTGHEKVAADFAKHLEEKHRREDFKGAAERQLLFSNRGSDVLPC